MIDIECTLNQEVDGELELRVGDSPVLAVTLYDDDGSDWGSGFSATLVVRRNIDDPDGQITITAMTEATPRDDNLYYFLLGDITFSPGNYEAFVQVTNVDWDDDPIPVSPEDEIYSFEMFKITIEA